MTSVGGVHAEEYTGVGWEAMKGSAFPLNVRRSCSDLTLAAGKNQLDEFEPNNNIISLPKRMKLDG